MNRLLILFGAFTVLFNFAASADTIATLAEKITKLQKDVKAITDKSGGLQSTYIHWGKTECKMIAKTIYSGFIGGAWSYESKGQGAPNKLCLPNEPQWGVQDPKVNDNPGIVATFLHNYGIDLKGTMFDQKNNQYRLECAVCLKEKSTTIMIPGRKECYEGWTKEYAGYLLGGHPTHKTASEYICVDGNPDLVKKTNTWWQISLLYAVESRCHSSSECQKNYSDGKEMVCVVCSK